MTGWALLTAAKDSEQDMTTAWNNEAAGWLYEVRRRTFPLVVQFPGACIFILERLPLNAESRRQLC